MEGKIFKRIDGVAAPVKQLVLRELRNHPIRILLLLFVFLSSSFFSIFLLGTPNNPQKALAATLNSEGFEGTHSVDTALTNANTTWDNVTGDDGQWRMGDGNTPSSNTGPSAAQEGSQIAYVETSSGQDCVSGSQVCSLQYDSTFDADTYDITVAFYTHMWGAQIGTLHLEVNQDSGGWVSRWSATGDQGNQWDSRSVDLSQWYTSGSLEVRFRNIANGSYQGDTSIDNIVVTGTVRNDPPAAPTLHDTPFDNEKLSDTTPDFEFTGSDPDGTDDIIYQFQLDDDQAFGSLLINCESDTTCATGAGSFTNTVTGGDTSPFNEGERIRFTPTTTLVNGTTYWWRVLAEDTVAKGVFTTPVSITIDTGLTTSEWFQTTDEQFNNGTLSVVETSGSDSVQMGATKATFTTPGSTTWDVPTGVTSITVKTWGGGAGGGGGGNHATNGVSGAGGGGGYSQSTLTVTPGETLNIHVGGGGGGGLVQGTTTAGGDGGGGGGRSEVERSTTPLIVAAGGGGGGGGDNSAGAGSAPGGAGGGGGGATGVAGTTSGTAGGGGGGTTSAGGAGGTGGATAGAAGAAEVGGAGGDNNAGTTGNGPAGGALGGGNGGLGSSAAYGSGGGGGSGRYGGGGGSASTASEGGAGGGGGGSNYLTGTSQTNSQASGVNPPNTGDSDYAGNAGLGGAGNGPCTDGTCSGTAGNPGRIVINYAATSGTIMSPEMDYDWVSGATGWGQAKFSTTETNGDVKLKLYYTVTTPCDTIVPDGTLSGNSSGFDVSASPISIASLTPTATTYNKICLQATLTDSGGTPFLLDWGVSWATGFDVSGTVYLANETTQATTGNGGQCNSSTANLSLRIDGGSAVTTTCSSTDGSFTFTAVAAVAGNTITIYSTDATDKSNRVYVSDGTVDTGMNLYKDTVVVGDEQDGTVTIVDLIDYDNDQNATDMLFDAEDAAPDTFVSEASIELHIHTGDTFNPGGTVTTSTTAGDVHVDDSATLTLGVATNSIGRDLIIDTSATASANSTTTVNDDIAVTGTMNGTGNVTVLGDVTGSGTITMTAGTFEQSPDDASKNFGTTSGSNNWSFSNLTFSDSCGGPCVPGNITITTQTGGSGGITVSGVLKVTNGGDTDAATLNAGNRTWTLSGTGGDPFQLTTSPAAALTASTSTFAYTGNNGGGNTTVQTATYNNLTINNGSETFVLEAATTASNDLTITAGILDVVSGSNYALTVGNSYSNSGTFTAQSGTVTFNATDTGNTLGGTMTGGSSFYDLVFNGVGGEWTFNAAVATNRDMTVTNGNVLGNSNALTIARDITLANTSGVGYTPATSTVTVGNDFNDTGNKFIEGAASTLDMTGSSDNTGTLNTNTSFYNLTLSGSGKTITIGVNMHTVNGVMTVNGGTVTVAGGTYINLQGTTNKTPFVFGAATTITGNNTLAFRITGGTNVVFTMAAGDYGSWAIETYTSSTNNSTYNFAGNITTTGNFLVAAGDADTGTSVNTQNHNLTANKLQFGDGNSGREGAVTVNLGSSTVIFSTTSSDSISPHSTTGGTGSTLNMGTSNVTVSGNVLFVNATKSITVDDGTSSLTWNHTSGTKTYSPNSQTLYDVTLNGSGGTVTPDAAVVIANDLTMSAGTLSGTQNITVNGTVVGTAGIISLTGGTFEQRVAAAENFGTTSGTTVWTFNNLTFSNSHGSTGFTVTTQTGGTGGITVAGNLLVGKSGDAAGATTTLSAGNRTWTLSDTDGDPFQILASPAGVLTAATSTFAYTGNNGGGNTTVQTGTYNNLVINNGSEIFVLEAATTVSGNLTITAGTLDVVSGSNYALNIGGNYSNSGTFTAQSGNITFNGSSTQTLSGTMTGGSAFYDLTITNNSGASASDCERTGFTPSVDFGASATASNNYVITTANVRVEYESAQTYTFNDVNWDGQASGTKIFFRNSLTSGSWLLNVTANPQIDVSYVDVSRSDASGGSEIQANNGTNVDCNNNTNWNFTALFEQADFRFGQPNGLDIDYTGAPAENAAYTTSGTGDNFRLRMLIHVSGSNLSTSGETFKLQFGEKTGATCTSGVTWGDVATGSGVIRFYNGANTDGDNLTGNAGDPVHNSDTTINQDYEEANNFTNSVATINAGQDGMWDFSLENNSAVGGKRYCFKTVLSTGADIDTYTNYPEVIIDEELIFNIDATSKDWGVVTPGANPTNQTTTLTITTNAASGYVVYTWATQAMTMGSYTIPVWTGTNASPTAFNNGSFGFGYTTDDNDLSGGTATRFAAGTLYAGFVNSGPGDPVADRTSGPVTAAADTITYRLAADVGQEAGKYETVVIYTASITF